MNPVHKELMKDFLEMMVSLSSE